MGRLQQALEDPFEQAKTCAGINFIQARRKWLVKEP